MIKPRLLALALLPGLCAAPFARAATPRFHVAGQIALPGPVKWDYLATDPAAHRIFAAQGDRVDVIDTRTQRRIGTIGNVRGTHGIALAPRFGHGFATAGIAGTVTMFDLKTLRTIRTIDVGRGPDGIAYDPSSRLVLVPNEVSQTLFAIDPANGRIVGSLPFHADPEFIVADGRGRVYLNLKSANRIAVIDPRAMTILREIDVAPACTGPTGLAIDRADMRLFVSCRNDVLAVVDARGGKVVASLPLPGFADAVRYDARDALVLAPSIDGTLSIVRASPKDGSGDEYRVIQRLGTAPGARTLTFDATTRTAYLSTAKQVGMLPPAPGKTYPRRAFKPGSFHVLVVRASAP
ncbi:YncE family protein [Acidiphilium sp. C61]|jgi:DNA-binding beta-propeller fold protein YncE|uniref:YncE family protein n=1 Tax=Acidiphilium sp. C61 TaxID=1671485 RepID=UPI00157AB765|nr:YncE family protein [Acidiphilium sp. C61]